MKGVHVYVYVRSTRSKKFATRISFKKAVNQNRDVSGPMFISIFICLWSQLILKFMEGNIESPYIFNTTVKNKLNRS
jgi:hypothetical protein